MVDLQGYLEKKICEIISACKDRGVKLLILARLDFLQKCVIIKVQFDETEPFRWDAIENEPANLL